MSTMKRTVRVTITKEIEIELTPSMFGGMTEEQYIAEFRKGLWDIDGIDDVFKYAARMAADGAIGSEQDGLGLINSPWSEYPRRGDVLAQEISCDFEEEFIEGAPT